MGQGKCIKRRGHQEEERCVQQKRSPQWQEGSQKQCMMQAAAGNELPQVFKAGATLSYVMEPLAPLQDANYSIFQRNSIAYATCPLISVTVSSVNLIQPRLAVEERISVTLSTSDWPVDMSVEDCPRLSVGCTFRGQPS